MSNEKQQKIVEMAKDICRYQPCCNDVCKPISACDALKYAERAVEAGYVKPEWISVDDRLPTYEDGKVLIYTPYGISIAQKTTTNHWKGDNAIPKLITHWMPLPEAPKGGAE